MQVYCITILPVLSLLASTTLAGNKDHDNQFGQVPVKDSPVRSLNNLTVSVADVSKAKGCHGNNCKSAQQTDRTSYRAGGRGYRGGGGGGYDIEDGGSQETDICDERREYGDCGGRRMRWFFNPRDGLCRRFVYSGCGGNGNNFRSRRRCESECNYYFDDASSDY